MESEFRLIDTIFAVPRRIINHRCGGNWQSSESGTNSVNQYVERGGVNFYRVHANYFFGTAENQRVRIQGHGYSTITVCMSRYNDQPRYILFHIEILQIIRFFLNIFVIFLLE